MSGRMMTSAVLAVGVLVAVGACGACGTSSESSSTPAVCPAPPAASPISNGPDSPSGSPNAPKLTAMEIAQRLPPMPPSLNAYGFGDDWNDDSHDQSIVDTHVVSSARRGWSAHSDYTFGNRNFDGGTMYLRVYDSPATRLAAEQAVPQGLYRETKVMGGPERTWVDEASYFRCFTTCGAVSVEVWTDAPGYEDVLPWANDAIVQSQSGLEQNFGGCPAWDDVGVPPSEGSP